MSKRRYYLDEQNPNEMYNKTVQVLRNKYFNLYRAQFKWNGINYRQEDYIMKKFYGDGTVSAFRIKNLDELGFAPWVRQSWDMYGLPETVLLINEHGSPLVPNDIQTVDKDVCIGYIQRNKKSIFMVVDWYVKRIAEVEMVINTNLQLHKMPFLVSVTEENKKKAEDIIKQILNNELVVFTDIETADLGAVSTIAPYIIDKLVDYKNTLENELKTYLGVNNNGVEKQEQLQLGEINANNDEIMDNENNFFDCLQEWCKNIKETLGIEISVERTSEPIEVMGQEHELTEKTGPKESEEDNDD